MPAPSGQSRRRARGSRHVSRIGSANSDLVSSSAEGSGTNHTAAELVQDAQDAAAELKGFLTSQPPWAIDVDTVRQRSRNALLAVLFQHPLSPHAQSIDTLWFNTTYSLISEYRQIVARIEAVLPSVGTRRSVSKQTAGNNDAVNDLRRTLARFRTLLSNEETFYRSLISRLVGFYRLQDRTQEHLALVGIPVATDDGVDDPSLAPPLSRDEMEKKLSMVYKGLVYLGDLERYKEQYSDKARREAREAVPSRNAERYSRAILFYEVARGIQPDNGQAFNQLAVVDGYLGDNFHCTYHYFRALAVKQPFPSGRANLERVFKKAFDRWRGNRHTSPGASEEAPLEDAETFRRDLLTVLAIHFLKAGTTHLPQLRPNVLSLLARLLRSRQLPSETIVKATAMVIGSHWLTRFDQSSSQADLEPDAGNVARQTERRRSVEELSLIFLVTYFTALLSVSAVEVEEVLQTRQNVEDSALASDDEAEADTEMDGTLLLAQRITAVLRRILPALRIASRWLKSHLDYVARASDSRNEELSNILTNFWTEYKRFMLALASLFPLAQLPSLIEALEEDVDMAGFLPLRRGTSADQTSFEDIKADNPSKHEVHPNEEQLMRISDLLVDVKLLMQTEYGTRALSQGIPLPSAPFVTRSNMDEAASISVSTETEDDPVNLAMRATLTEGSSLGDVRDDYDEDEEVILLGRHTPIVHEASPNTSAQTAQELMQNLTLKTAHPAPTAPLLFGGGDVGGGGSIWTMSREESQKGAQRSSAGAIPPNLANIWHENANSSASAQTPVGHAPPSSMWSPSHPPQSQPHPQQSHLQQHQHHTSYRHPQSHLHQPQTQDQTHEARQMGRGQLGPQPGLPSAGGFTPSDYAAHETAQSQQGVSQPSAPNLWNGSTETSEYVWGPPGVSSYPARPAGVQWSQGFSAL